MAFYDKILDSLGRSIAGYMTDRRKERSHMERDYYTGDHPEQLKLKPGQYNDNLAMNYVGLAIARGVSRLFNGGIEFHLPEGHDKQAEYLEQIWDTNNQEQLLYQLALNGGVYGTPFVKIVPDGITNRITGAVCPRLVALDPEITTVIPDPFDVDEPEVYNIEFTIGDRSYKEVTRKAQPNDFEDPQNAVGSWIVEHFILDKSTGGKWLPDPNKPPVQWPYDFAPILHWKNLPALKAHRGCYGATDAEWALGIQDKLNFADSNINKTIRMNAAPPTIVTGVATAPEMATGPGSLTWFSDPEAKAYNLQANADIDGARAFASDLQSGIFQLMREVPPAVIQQLGSGLTNFVMRVVFSDAIEKNDTKRELYGDAICELNRRMLVLAGMEGEESDPGIIEWGDALPTNPAEQIAEDTFLLANGLVSKQTIAKKYDIDYEAEKELLAQEASDKNALGGNLLRDFLANKNQGETL